MVKGGREIVEDRRSKGEGERAKGERNSEQVQE